MQRGVILAGLLALLGSTPLFAQVSKLPATEPAASSRVLSDSWPEIPPLPLCATADEANPKEVMPWQTAWGLLGIRVIPGGPKIAPNGEEYHPNFSIDLDFNIWLWRDERLYLFSDLRLWGQKGEHGVTNSRDGFMGTSKREFDLSGGAAWNYKGPWELRAEGYTNNNLNRGTNPVAPHGFTDGFGMENRYYLSPEYAKLGQTGYDVARATFLSVGYFPSKDMVGNDGQTFAPGMMLRAYLIQDLWDWPAYAFVDAMYISERSFEPRLMLFDVGLAIRPLRCCQQFEFRLGSENTADLQARDDFALWYLAFRYIF